MIKSNQVDNQVSQWNERRYYNNYVIYLLYHYWTWLLMSEPLYMPVIDKMDCILINQFIAIWQNNTHMMDSHFGLGHWPNHWSIVHIVLCPIAINQLISIIIIHGFNSRCVKWSDVCNHNLFIPVYQLAQFMTAFVIGLPQGLLFECWLLNTTIGPFLAFGGSHYHLRCFSFS